MVGTTEKRTRSTGVLRQNGKVTVEAEGEFVNINRDKLEALHRMRTRHEDAEP